MPNKKISLFLIILFLCSGIKLFSQITATSGPISVCAPANITFNAPAGASSISWTFGSAFPASNNASGSFNAISATSFNAVFNGIVGGSPVSFTVPVVVHARPTSAFAALPSANSCSPRTVTLTDQSTFSSPIQSWNWIYGDGNQNTFTNGSPHTYTYVGVGSYSVSLVVTDANGCSHSSTFGPINVIAPPVANISSNPSSLVGCSANFNAVFSASNSVGTGLTYNWNFGNSQTSTQVTSGSITYSSQAAQYPVTLTVTAGGCSAVTSTFVTVSPATLSVSISPTVCKGASSVATVITNQPYSFWDLGNSNTAFVISPAAPTTTVSVPAYSLAGTYTITISAGTAPCLATPVSVVVMVDQVVASFTTNPTNISPSCSSTAAISFTNLSSSSATSFLWSHTAYPSGNSVVSSTLASPTITFSQGSLNPYTIFSKAYTTFVTLVVTNAAGCTASKSDSVRVIEQPTAWFNKSKKEGCVPLVVTFSDSSHTFTNNPITSYTWCNGATPSVIVAGTTSAPNFTIPSNTFTYATVGVYYPYLIIQTANGCNDISFIDTVTVVDPPIVSFNFSPSGPVCPNVPIQITNTSPSSLTVQHWHLESDNGFFSGCVSDANPSWQYTQIGTHTLGLSGYLHSCKGTYVSPQTIAVKGPIAKLNYETNCTNKFSVDFLSELQGVNTAILNFGDNSSVTFSGSPTGVVVVTTTAHTYSATGNYTAILTATNFTSTCPASIYSVVVRVRNITASITSPTVGCAGLNVMFNAAASQDVYLPCSRGYVWLVDNLPPVETTQTFLSTSFASSGIHTVTLKVSDINSCRATVTETVRISAVNAGFSLSSNTVCSSTGTIQITNNTTQIPDPITNYFWTYGDGQILSTSSATPLIHNYINAAVPFTTYQIALTASNSIGCVKTVSQTLQVIKPLVSFNASPQNLCLVGTTPGTINFNSNTANTSYTLGYGVSPSSTLITGSASTSYTYANEGSYAVSMQVKTAAGCVNIGSILVNTVRTPTADFIFNSPGSNGGNVICAGGENGPSSFTNVSSPIPYTPTWNLGTSILSSTNNVVTQLYNGSGTVAISLTVTTGAPAYCKASTSKNFTIYAADATIALSKTLICLGESIELGVTQQGSSAWVWDYGDASPSPTVYANSTPPPSSVTLHTYTNYSNTVAGSVTVSLLYWSLEEACTFAAPIATLRLINIEPDFKRNLELAAIDSLHCVNIPDVFTNTSSSNSSSLSYFWSFSNGFLSAENSPAYTFTNAGTYQLSLTATGEANCKVSTVKNMTIFPLPSAYISAGFNCPNLPFPIVGNSLPGAVSGTWSPQSGMVSLPEFTSGVSNSTFSSSAMASITSTYSLSVTDANGCVSIPTSTTIYIQQPPPVIIWDTSVVVGQSVPINAYEGPYTYTWTPLVADLNCITCYNPISTTTVDLTYSVSVEDTLHCSAITSRYSIKILPKTSVDVPTAFTPNNDGVNDIIYVGGWGIKKLIYFKVFNRYGQLVFETSDIKIGWDGMYRGVPQNMETYVYQVSVETYLDKEPITKSGTFKIIK